MARKKKFPIKQMFKARGWTTQGVEALLNVPAQDLKAWLCTNEDRRECDRLYRCEIADTKSGAVVAYARCRKIELLIERIVDMKEFSG
jgi:hypothetical protein